MYFSHYYYLNKYIMAGCDANTEFLDVIPVLEQLEHDAIENAIENVGGITTISPAEYRLYQKSRCEIWRTVCRHHNICHMFKNDDGTFVCMACFRMEKLVYIPRYKLIHYRKFEIMMETHWHRKTAIGGTRRGFLPSSVQPAGLVLRLPRPARSTRLGQQPSVEIIKLEFTRMCTLNVRSLWRTERWSSPLSWLMYYPERWSTLDERSFERYFKEWRLIQLTYWFKQCLRRTWVVHCLRRHRYFVRQMKHRWFSRWQQYQCLKAAK